MTYLSFNIDPSPSLAAPVTCEYACVGGDVAITPPVEPFDISGSVNVIESITAANSEHLQKKEKKMLMWDSKNDTTTSAWIDRDRVIDKLIQKLTILIVMVVDPHGQLGPFVM